MSEQNDAAADAAYAVAVVAKQKGLTLSEAQKVADDLSAETRAQLVACGRNGQVDDCKRLLGLLPPVEAVEPAKPTKGKKSKKDDPPAGDPPAGGAESNA